MSTRAGAAVGAVAVAQLLLGVAAVAAAGLLARRRAAPAAVTRRLHGRDRLVAILPGRARAGVAHGAARVAAAERLLAVAGAGAGRAIGRTRYASTVRSAADRRANAGLLRAIASFALAIAGLVAAHAVDAEARTAVASGCARGAVFALRGAGAGDAALAVFAVAVDQAGITGANRAFAAVFAGDGLLGRARASAAAMRDDRRLTRVALGVAADDLAARVAAAAAHRAVTNTGARITVGSGARRAHSDGSARHRLALAATAARLALTVAATFAAHAVGAKGARALAVARALAARLLQIFADAGFTVGAGRALRVGDAVAAASGGAAGERRAVHRLGRGAVAGAVAERLLHCGAGLGIAGRFQANRLRAREITGAAQLAGAAAVAGRTVTATGRARTVRVTGHDRASAFLGLDVARLTLAGAGGVAANAVDAVRVGLGALGVVSARLASTDAQLARVVDAVVRRLATVVAGAILLAEGAVAGVAVAADRRRGGAFLVLERAVTGQLDLRLEIRARRGQALSALGFDLVIRTIGRRAVACLGDVANLPGFDTPTLGTRCDWNDLATIRWRRRRVTGNGSALVWLTSAVNGCTRHTSASVAMIALSASDIVAARRCWWLRRRHANARGRHAATRG